MITSSIGTLLVYPLVRPAPQTYEVWSGVGGAGGASASGSGHDGVVDIKWHDGGGSTQGTLPHPTRGLVYEFFNEILEVKTRKLCRILEF